MGTFIDTQVIRCLINCLGNGGVPWVNIPGYTVSSWNMCLEYVFWNIYSPEYRILYTGHIPGIFFVKMLCWQHYKEEAIF